MVIFVIKTRAGPNARGIAHRPKKKTAAATLRLPQPFFCVLKETSCPKHGYSMPISNSCRSSDLCLKRACFCLLREKSPMAGFHQRKEALGIYSAGCMGIRTPLSFQPLAHENSRNQPPQEPFSYANTITQAGQIVKPFCSVPQKSQKSFPGHPSRNIRDATGPPR